MVLKTIKKSYKCVTYLILTYIKKDRFSVIIINFLICFLQAQMHLRTIMDEGGPSFDRLVAI